MKLDESRENTEPGIPLLEVDQISATLLSHRTGVLLGMVFHLILEADEFRKLDTLNLFTSSGRKYMIVNLPGSFREILIQVGNRNKKLILLNAACKSRDRLGYDQRMALEKSRLHSVLNDSLILGQLLSQ